MTAVQKILVIVTMFVTVSVDVGIYEAYRATTPRTRLQPRPRPQASLFEGIQQLPFEPDDAVKSMASVEGIMSHPNFSVVIHALEQRSGFENLAEPEAVTTSGRQAQMRFVNFLENVVLVVTNSPPTSTSQHQPQ
jgi:Flp pilus assembly secretin CpaC